MKKQLSAMAMALAVALPSNAADIALVFPGPQAVKDGNAILGTLTSGGVVVSLKDLGDARELFAGIVGGALQKASLVRMDNELQVALLKLTTPVDDAALASAFQARAQAIGDFLPRPADGSTSGAITAAPAVPKEMYVIKVDGQEVGAAPIRLKTNGRQSNCRLEILKMSGKPSWRVVVRLSSTPSLGFWKESEQRGLSSVPSKSLVFRHQALFSPMSQEDTIKFPIQISSIKESEYNWTVRIEAKEGNFEKTFPVVFEPK